MLRAPDGVAPYPLPDLFLRYHASLSLLPAGTQLSAHHTLLMDLPHHARCPQAKVA